MRDHHIDFITRMTKKLCREAGVSPKDTVRIIEDVNIEWQSGRVKKGADVLSLINSFIKKRKVSK